MATAPLIIMDMPVASPAAPTNTPFANDNVACWTQDRRAKLLLASCIASPPAGEVHETRYVRTTDKFFRYADYRAEALEAIRMEHGDRVTLAYQLEGENAYPPLQAWCRQPDATGAIDAALSAASREG